MTLPWAPTEAQKAVFTKLANDPTLISLLGANVEVQRLTLSGTPASGSFKLNFNGNATAAISGVGLSAAIIQAALRLVTGLETVTVSLFAANIYDVTMTGVAGNAPAMTASDNSLATVAPLSVSITVSEFTKGVQKVFDFVPDNTPYPYIVLQVLPWTDRGSHTYEGWACEFQLATWYRAPSRGNLQVQTIQKRIDELLHRVDLCIEGWNSISLRRTFVDILTEDDNVTKQGLQRFNLLIGEG
jgi:hypothetical protein